MYGTAIGRHPFSQWRSVPDETFRGSWTLDVLHVFTSSPDGALPYGAVALDPAGNIFGTTQEGGGISPENYGTVYEISPSGSGWTEGVLYPFVFDSGINPYVGLVRDPSGNLYGAAGGGGPMGGGTIFELSPSVGSYLFSVIYNSFPEDDGGGAGSRLLMDQDGNLYGTAPDVGAHNQGMVYELSPTAGSWILTDLHDFDGSDGSDPQGDIARDADGNLYGVTTVGEPMASVSFGRSRHRLRLKFVIVDSHHAGSFLGFDVKFRRRHRQFQGSHPWRRHHENPGTTFCILVGRRMATSFRTGVSLCADDRRRAGPSTDLHRST